jgi:hypothetical protein
MKTLIHKTGKKSEALISAIIVLALVLAVVAVMHLRARGFRDTANLQLDADKAYSLAKSGVGIGKSFIPSGGSSGDPCSGAGGGVSCDLIHKSYNLTGGNSFTIDIDPCNGTLTSSGKAGKSVRFVKNSFPPVVGGTGGGGIPTWAKVYALSGIERVSSTLKTQDGGYLIEAETDVNAANEDILLIKIDRCGIIQWAKTYGGSQRELCTAEYTATFPGDNTILEVSGKGADDGYYVAKSTNTFGVPGSQYDFFLIKLDKNNGDIVWAKSIGFTTTQEYLHDFRDDGTGLVLAGESNGGMFVMKVDYAATTKAWAYRYDYATKSDVIEAVVPFEESGVPRYLLAGHTFQAAKGGDKSTNLRLLKITGATGDITAQKMYSTDAYDYIFAAKKSFNPSTGSFDGFILAGLANTGSTLSGIMLKLEPALTIGTSGWYKIHNVVSNFLYRDVIQDSSGNYYVTGLRGMPSVGDCEALLLKTDYNGVFKWMKEYGDGQGGSGYEDEFTAIDITDSGFILGGTTMTLGGSGTKDSFIVRTDALGDVPGCSIVRNEQSIGNSSLVFSSVDTSLTKEVLTSTVNVNPVPKENITVKTYPGNLTVNTVNKCP